MTFDPKFLTTTDDLLLTNYIQVSTMYVQALLGLLARENLKEIVD